MTGPAAKPIDTTPDQRQERVWAALGYKPRPQQALIHAAWRQYRFVSAVCHRRFGKTVGAVADLYYYALTCPLPYAQCFYVAPTERAAKRIAWGYVQRFADRIPGATVRQLDLRVELPNRAIIQLLGSDSPDRLRGLYADAVVMDELAFQREQTWTSVIRPALSDRRGRALFISTPNGHNLFWRLTEYARDPDHEQWNTLTFRASETGILPESELADLRGVMSRDEYEREYEVSFSAPPRGALYGQYLMGDDPYTTTDELQRALDKGVIELWWALDRTTLSAVVVACRYDGRIFLLEGSAFIDFSEALGYARNKKEEYGIERVLLPAVFMQMAVSSAAGQARLLQIRDAGLLAIEQEQPSLSDGVESVRSALREGKLLLAPTDEGRSLAVDLAQVRFVYDDRLDVPKAQVVKDLFAPLDAAVRLGVTAPTLDLNSSFDDDLPDYGWVV